MHAGPAHRLPDAELDRAPTPVSEAVLRCTRLPGLTGLGPALLRPPPPPEGLRIIMLLRELRGGEVGSSFLGGGLDSRATLRRHSSRRAVGTRQRRC